VNGLTEDQERDYRATVRIRDHAEDLAVYVATWQEAGNDRRRLALNEALDAADGLLRAAHTLRESLALQAERHDKARDASVDALLEEIRKEDES
jgi:hypothetical protein